MRIFSYVLLLLIISFTLEAQQVKKIDCCQDVTPKATIIINESTSNGTTSSTTTTSTNPTNGVFNFELKSSLNTSAGVYNSSGVLIRTLWSGARYDVGCYSAAWDGYLDDGVTVAPVGDYTIKVLTNNVTAKWESGIGNTSDPNHVNKAFSGIATGGLTVSADKLFYGESFAEGEISSKYYLLSDITYINNVDNGISFIQTACCNDGVNIYWTGFDDYQQLHGQAQLNAVWATKVTDNSPVAFPAGIAFQNGRSRNMYNYFIGAFFKNNTAYSGLAVNNFLFSASPATGKLSVFNKTTGNLIKETILGKPFKIATKTDGELWVLDQDTKIVTKYNVGGDGNLASSGITINGLVDPNQIQVNPVTKLVAVLERGTHQIKFYSSSTGQYLSSFGQAGGFITNGPIADYNKFSFGNHSDFAYQPDGSLWITDDGNDRLMHFDAALNYIQQSCFILASRCTTVDANNPERLFSDLKEYKIDYSKPIDNGLNGSWKFVKSWIGGTVAGGWGGFTRVVTLTNGYTYAYGANSNLYILDNAYGSRLVSNNFYGTLEADGSLWQRRLADNKIIITKQEQIGTDANHIPLWGNETVVATTPVLTASSPAYYVNNTIGASTNPSRYFFYDPNYGNRDISPNGEAFGLGYHLGSIKTGGNTWDWQTSKSTNIDYHGDYPRNGYFDIGNSDYGGGQHSENALASVSGKFVFWHVNAEFWQTNTGANNGVNITNIFNEDGLFIANFGVTANEAKTFLGNKGNAGNSFANALTKVGNDYYFYHCDESQWASVHRWKISGLDNVVEQVIPIKVVSTVTVPPDRNSLMAGLPYLSRNFTGDSNWTVNYPTSGLVMPTNYYQYGKDSTDIKIGGANKQVVRRTLNNTSSLASWTLSGGMSYGLNGQPTLGDGSDNYNFLEVLDLNGKIIARFSDSANPRNGYYHTAYLNNQIVKQGSPFNGEYPFASLFYKNFSFSYAAGILSFTYNPYNTTSTVTVTTPFEPGAELSKPAYLRVNQGSPGNQYHEIDLYKVRFVIN